MLRETKPQIQCFSKNGGCLAGNAKQILIKIRDAFTMSMKKRKGENLGLC